MKKTRDLKIGDIVLLKDQVLYVNKWPLGRIIETYSGKENVVRVVKVRTSNAIYKRLTAKIVLLLPNDEDSRPSVFAGENVLA